MIFKHTSIYMSALIACVVGAFFGRYWLYAGYADPFSPAHQLSRLVEFSLYMSGIKRFCLELFTPLGMVVLFSVGIYVFTFVIQQIIQKNSSALAAAKAEIEKSDLTDIVAQFEIYKNHNVSLALPMFVPVVRIGFMIFIMAFFIRGILLPADAINPFLYANVPCAGYFAYRFITLEREQQLELAGIINILLIVFALVVFPPATALFVFTFSLLMLMQEIYTKGREHAQNKPQQA